MIAAGKSLIKIKDGRKRADLLQIGNIAIPGGLIWINAPMRQT
jgi:hypothetical protein